MCWMSIHHHNPARQLWTCSSRLASTSRTWPGTISYLLQDTLAPWMPLRYFIHLLPCERCAHFHAVMLSCLLTSPDLTPTGAVILCPLARSSESISILWCYQSRPSCLGKAFLDFRHVHKPLSCLLRNPACPLQKPGIIQHVALQVFRPHVLGWILTSQEALCQRCRVIEATTYATAAAGPEGRMPEDGEPLYC